MSAEKVPLLPLPSPEERRKLRDQMGITRKDASSEVGVTVRTYLRWETGEVEPTPTHHRKYQEQLQQWREAVNSFL
jgi:predicted transcriptional regulator